MKIQKNYEKNVKEFLGLSSSRNKPSSFYESKSHVKAGSTRAESTNSQKPYITELKAQYLSIDHPIFSKLSKPSAALILSISESFSFQTS